MRKIKEREPSAELKILRLLHPRMQLPDRQYYLHLEKGYAGELQMDAWIEQGLVNDCLVVNDLLLEHKRKVFQIDSLLIFQEMIHVFDSKNFEGDFYVDANTWSSLAGREINNPLYQMERAKSLLRQLLQRRLGINLPIESFLIFINPEFTLYNAQPKLPAVFHSQLKPFMKKLNNIDSKLNRGDEKLAEQLVALHSDEPPNIEKPKYSFEQLKKGVVCGDCGSFMLEKGRSWVCGGCGHKENAQAAIIRSAEAFKLLFPDRKITSNTICEWCAVEGDRKKVVRALTNHFKRVGDGPASYYAD
ncbi:nuclease-related domain-containing protein [Natribacillus halophilus]|uniref:Nuclease-related domain-containing protein n=1 Tax=Natribacillus halophilus TaxID=549003 RepID=A0A1G8PGW1_9BACI|nr:nuclease-related domain-containing protein [Natribacillus halophilus]SDI91677.1 Nuclease-related domain-containing protein [Natribacillus halophilus]